MTHPMKLFLATIPILVLCFLPGIVIGWCLRMWWCKSNRGYDSREQFKDEP
jgi:hypothetical protein